jgi:hypothetical protein
MREIKFRCWDKEAEKMHEVWGVTPITLCTKEGAQFPCYESRDKFVLMQYTGLKDGHGKEIYEGDVVVQFTGSGKEAQRGDVRWSTNETGYQIGDAECWRLGIYAGMFGKNSLEVIGNIYENPDLLV